MIHNYFKIALRTLKKHKQFSIINIFGLSMALIVAICIMLYVEDEMSYDRFHPNAEQLYRVTMETRFSEKDFHTAWTPPFIAARMKEELPEVENYATLYKHFKGFSIKKENEEISIEDVYYSSPNFFEVFGFRLKYGNPKTALAHPDNIVLSEELIDKLFPGETVMGTTIETINGPKKVTGIMAENDQNSHFHPSIITSIIGHWDIEELSTAVNFDATFYNYVVLSPGSKIPSGKMIELTERYASSWINADQQRKEQFGHQPIKFQLQNVRDIHLESNLEFEMETNGDKATVRLFMLVAILIVVVASVNYTNLASTRYLERMKESGIRKVLGSRRWQLTMQFFTESLIITFASVLIALLFLQLMLPVFNSIAGKSFDFHQLSEFKIMAGIGILAFGCALLSTLYPAFFISNIKAISIFQVNSAGIGKGNRFRRMILILQISTSGILLVFTFVLVQQLKFMQSYDLGFQQDQVLVLEVKAREARAKIPVLKNELLKLQAIKSIGLSGQIPGEAGLKTEPFAFESNEGDMVELLTNYMFTGPDIISALDLQIQLGSIFNPEKGGANRGQEVIVNETLVKAMNWKDPIGKKVNLPIGEASVVGVIKDFHLKSLHHIVEPLTLIYLDNWAEALLIRTSPEDLERTVQSVGNIYKKVIPNTGFHYSFLDDRFARQYTADQQQAKLFMVFSVLTVAIACLGILGIVGFSLVRRSKEMSIRRVFGANYLQVIFLLMREYGSILLIGTLITIPLANYLAKEWLMHYPYKINLSVIHFALPVFGLILLIAAIIFARSYAAIRTNPAEVLKDE